VLEQPPQRIEKKISTWLSHDAWVGVNWKRQRGWASSHFWTFSVPRVERLSVIATIFWPSTTGISASR